MIRRTIALAIAFSALAAGPAASAIKTFPDGEGNRITIDVRAKGAEPARYAEILAETIHGDEINDVTVRVVSRRKIAIECHPLALACYGAEPGKRPLIFVPAIPAERLRNTLVHEYGHHVDQAYTHRTAAVPGRLDGTARWWSARRVAGRLNRRQIAFDYRKGWERSLPEIFAEDFAVTNLGGGAVFDIPWLKRPSARVQNALKADLADPIGLSQRRVGVAWLRRGSDREVYFRLTKAQRVSVRTVVRNKKGRRIVASSLVCNGRVVGRSKASVRRPASIRPRRVAAGALCHVAYAATAKPALLESFIRLR